MVGAERLDSVLPMLLGKAVALVVNQTSMVGAVHLADTLVARGVNVKKVFAPEHGFRGTADAGEHVQDGKDARLGMPLVSLYGTNRKPTPDQLRDVDVVVFDIQDVGVRFYTYISTLHYVMEACAENDKKIVVLDRPNPNPFVDGPVLDTAFRSFLGMHPIPLAHGLTIGELAKMINGEGWLNTSKPCALEVVPMLHWTHNDSYHVPVKPSPNLPDDQSIRLYPSTGLFEGVSISLGRGTHTPFQVLGHPAWKGVEGMAYSFTPVSIDGMSKTPPFMNQTCYGIDLRAVEPPKRVDLSYLIQLYALFPDKDKYFNGGFNAHAGNSVLQQQIRKGMSEAEIRASWQPALDAYKEMRKKYLMYE